MLRAASIDYSNIHIIMLSNQGRYLIALQTIQKRAEQDVIKDKNASAKIAEMINEF